jgi:large subunit ribosomal protein L25
MPEYLEVDLSKLGPGDSVHLADITLPEGLIIVRLDAEDEESNLMLANAIHVAEEVEEEEDVEEGEEGDEDEEGAEDGDDDSDDEGDRD